MNNPKGAEPPPSKEMSSLAYVASFLATMGLLALFFLWVWQSSKVSSSVKMNPAAFADLSKTEFERRRGHVKLLERWNRSEPYFTRGRDTEELYGPLLLFYDDATGELWSLFCLLKPRPDGSLHGVGSCEDLMADIRRRGLVREAVPVELEIGKFHYGWRSVFTPSVSVSGVSIDRRIAGSYVIGGK